MQRQHLSPEDFENLGVLGRGAFAEVCLSRKRDTSAIYAMKRMRKADLVARGHVERAWTEWMVQSEADGVPWLVKLHFCFQTAEDVYLVMDFVPGGDLMGLLMRLDVLPEEEARFYAAQVRPPFGMQHAVIEPRIAPRTARTLAARPVPHGGALRQRPRPRGRVLFRGGRRRWRRSNRCTGWATPTATSSPTTF